MRTRGGQRGFSLIELMVSMAVAAIAVGFIFRIYATSSVAYRTQSQVAELQQALRTAKQTIAGELRKAGYFASAVNTAVDTGTGGTSPPTMTGTCASKHTSSGTTGGGAAAFSTPPVKIINSSTGPDEIHIAYADTNCMARIANGPNFTAAVTQVANGAQLSCFADGDVLVAVRLSDGACGSKRGWGCTLKVTGFAGGSGPNPKLQHNPGGSGSPFNQPGNKQCEHIATDWSDGQTAFVKMRVEGYRIKPNDRRGVLQYSATAGALNDWQDLAFGFVDMQFAVQVFEDGDVTDADGDGNGAYDWYSGENMENLTGELLQVRMSLVARTVAEIEGPGTLRTPALDGDGDPDNNPVGDRASVLIADYQSTPTSPYYGNFSYRMVSTVVDLRNLGVGREP